MIEDNPFVERYRVSPSTVTVLGYRVKDVTDPRWAGLFFEHAEPAIQSSMMLYVCGSHAPIDVHLRVPWCHPEEKTGSDDDWKDCVYRVRPKMEVGKRWKIRLVESVAFERWDGVWWVAITRRALKRHRNLKSAALANENDKDINGAL